MDLEHENILPLLGFVMQDHGDSEMFPSLVCEYMERGTLEDELKRNPNLDILYMARNFTSTSLKSEGHDFL